MSAAQNLQQHPVFVQAQNKVKYHMNQLDKELTKYPVLTSCRKSYPGPKNLPCSSYLTSSHHLSSHNPGGCAPSLTSWVSPSPPTSPSRPSSPLVTKMTSSGSPYWVVFATLGFVETFAMGAVLYYLPWYFVLKTVFLLWLQLPAFRGGYVTYARVINPLLLNGCASSRAVATPDTLTDNLRDRVNTANTE
ncbi:hypothetical protein EDC04DRAFT_2647104 [Pisolithus marmoratus]|nr:hypothetical protein EDC04DRAFT_2647104 [Pisolithus marmoratus]